MNTDREARSERPRRRGGWVIPTVVVGGILAGSVLVWAVLAGSGEKDNLGAVFVVRRGTLTIDVCQSGQVQNRDLEKIKSKVQGRNAIISIVEEGTHVKKDDLLVLLDSSRLEDRKEEQELSVDRAKAAQVGAETRLENTRSQSDSDVEKAKLDYEFAILDRRKYLEGDYQQQLMKATNSIQIAKQRKKQADDKLLSSKALWDKDFISSDEYERDKLSQEEAKLNLNLVNENLRILKKFSRLRKVKELESNVKQRFAALERGERKAKADVIQAEADLKSRESELRRQKERLTKLDEQIRNCRIVAPVDGMVVYATTGRRRRWSQSEPLARGAEVSERQELIHLPVSTKMMAEVKIHESALKKVKVGQRVRLMVEAEKDKAYWGRVGKISVYPDQASWWSNPDVKVYNTQIHLDGDAKELRAGMNCRAEIIVAEYKDAVYVPIQSVVRTDGKPMVYVVTRGRVTPREVEIGMDNGRMVHILGGLEEGEKVLEAPPLDESTKPISSGKMPEWDEKDEGETPADDGKKSAPKQFDPSKLEGMSREERTNYYRNLTPEQRKALRKRGGGRKGRRRRPRGKDARPPE